MPRMLVSLLLVVALVLGCAANFEESRPKVSLASKGPDPNLCLQLSSRASWEAGLAEAGAVATGSTGIAAWPVTSSSGRLGLAIGGTVLASGTVLLLTLYEHDAAEYLAQGCGTTRLVP